MATVIQIKRSSGLAAPGVSNLSEGELAYNLKWQQSFKLKEVQD